MIHIDNLLEKELLVAHYFCDLFFATPKYLKMQTFFPKVAAGNSSFLHVSPA